METSASFEARSAPWSYPAENRMGHGGPKRARSWKRRKEPRKTYRSWRSPLLGHAKEEPTGNRASARPYQVTVDARKPDKGLLQLFAAHTLDRVSPQTLNLSADFHFTPERLF